MTSSENTALRKIALSMLTRQAASGDAGAIAAAASRAYADLADVFVPLIGQVGVDALTARALHLAQQEYPFGSTRDAEESGGPFVEAGSWLEQQDPAFSTEAAAGILATFAALMATFIGESLTTRFLRKAWPGGFSDSSSEEIEI